MQHRYHSKMQCYVRSINYDFNKKRGQVVIGNGGCTDMSGCIEVFKSIDPEVIIIETGYGGDKLDTVYRKHDGEWEAI